MKTSVFFLTHGDLRPCATFPGALTYHNAASGHPWKRVAQGHYEILKSAWNVEGGNGVLVMENDIRLRKDFAHCLALAETAKPAGRPYIVSFYVVSAPSPYQYVKDAPSRLPDGFHDFGLQAIYYSPAAVPVAGALIGAYVACPLGPDPSAFSTSPRASAAREGIDVPVDFWLYPTLRTLGVDILHMAAVQHVPHPSGCLSPSHESMILTPEELQ